MVLFSELAVSGPLPQAAQPIPGPAEEALQAMAAKHDLWLVSGSMYESSGDHIYNTTSVIDPDGKVVASTKRATNTPLARSIPQRPIPAAEYYWPRQATLRQSFTDFEEEERMVHLKPLRASFKTRTVS